MFSQLGERLNASLQRLRGRGRLTEDNIKETQREIRQALLAADVALPVVKSFIAEVSEQALGQEVLQSLDPGKQLVSIVHQALVHALGTEDAPLEIDKQAPAIVLMAGLQGAGKTTTVAKLARRLNEVDKKKVAVVSTDVYRPAAIEQLKTLALEVGVDYIDIAKHEDPVVIANEAVKKAKQSFYDVLLIDTAGRLHIDDAMMTEIKALHKATQPIETLFIVDSMTGQDAANTAKAFHDALPLTGVVLSKADGDARGGAALSVRHITGKPIKFMGVGEKTDALQAFHPERLASQILGMGDILTLVEEAERKLSDKQRKKSEKLAKKIQKGRGFDLEDFRDQLTQIDKMGGMASLLDKMPGMGQVPKGALDKLGGGAMTTKMIAIIDSMTVQERRFPKVLNGSRKRRIAKGSGTDVPDINRLLKQYTQMQKMSKKMAKPGAMKKLMRQFGGQLPPEGF